MRQHREDERAQFPDRTYYEEVVSPWNIARAAIAAAEQWQPIETAPKDGTEVLLWHVRMDIGRWWKVCWLDREGVGMNATHWMPLPPPPKDKP